MSTHLSVDETKQRDYLLIASVHVSGQLDELRTDIRNLVLPGQRRLHMAKESDSRRRTIADTLANAGISATVYDAGRRYRHELDARAACLRALVDDAARHHDATLVIEQDDSLRDWDQRQLYTLTRRAQPHQLRYEHQRPGAEQLLAVPDTIAWCWAKGGHWRTRVQPIVTTVRHV